MPFENKFPKDTKLYKLMTSKFGEGYFAGSANSPSDEQEILNKIREVSMNNAEFDEMVKRYMDE